jgi:uncharacterized membrane protein (UPF0182 family)
VYVRPFYVTANETQVPGLEKVIVYFEGEVAIRDTLQEALAAVFGDAPPTLEEDPGDEPQDPDEPTGSVDEQVAELLVEAGALFDEADDALRDLDFSTYEEKSNEARAKIAEAEDILADAGILLRDPEDPETSTTTADGDST